MTMENKNYTYSDGTEVKAGDIFFYSEMPASNYADSIGEIFEMDGNLWLTWHLTNMKGSYMSCEGKTDDFRPVEQYSKDGVMEDIICIGNKTANPEMLTVAWATEHYPIGPDPMDRMQKVVSYKPEGGER